MRASARTCTIYTKSAAKVQIIYIRWVNLNVKNNESERNNHEWYNLDYHFVAGVQEISSKKDFNIYLKELTIRCELT